MQKAAANESGKAATLLYGSFSRRGFMGTCAAMPLVGTGIGGFAASAFASGSTRQFTGRYAIDSHRVIDGYFAWPRSIANADVVVVVPANGMPDDTARAVARQHCAAGRIAIVPDLPATYGRSLLGGRAAMIAALEQDVPRLRRLTGASGSVTFVSA